MWLRVETLALFDIRFLSRGLIVPRNAVIALLVVLRPALPSPNVKRNKCETAADAC